MKKTFRLPLFAVSICLLMSVMPFAAAAKKESAAALADEVVRHLENSGALDRAVDRAIERRIKQDSEQRQKAAEESRKRQMEVVKNLRKTDSVRDHVFGPATARISILVYSDLECPFCKRFAGVPESVAGKFEQQVNVIWRHFPLEMHGANAMKEAIASECVAKQAGNAGFFKFINDVLKETETNGKGVPGGDAAIVALAKRAAAMDEDAFKDCMVDPATAKLVDEDIKDGIAGGIEGTPGVVLRDNRGDRSLLVGGAIPAAALEARIREMLAAKSE